MSSEMRTSVALQRTMQTLPSIAPVAEGRTPLAFQTRLKSGSVKSRPEAWETFGF